MRGNTGRGEAGERVGSRGNDPRPRERVGVGDAELVEPVEDRGVDAEHRVVVEEAKEHRDTCGVAARGVGLRHLCADEHGADHEREEVPGLGEQRAVQHATARADSECRQRARRAAQIALDLLVRDLPRDRSVGAFVATDGPERSDCGGGSFGCGHRAVTRGILCGGPSRRSCSSGTSSISGTMPIAANTEPATSSRTASTRFACVAA